MVYFVFMVYFDNIRHQYLPALRQQLWAFMHFPFHLALVLFMEGATQFVVWWKVLEIENALSNTIGDALDKAGSTINKTSEIVDLLDNTITPFLTLYPPTYTDSVIALNEVRGNISTFPDSYWQTNFTDLEDPRLQPLIGNLTLLWDTLDNILLTKFKIDLTEDVAKSAPANASMEALQNQISDESWQRFNLVVRTTNRPKLACLFRGRPLTPCSSNTRSPPPVSCSSSSTCSTPSPGRRSGGRGTSPVGSSRRRSASACVSRRS